MTTTIAAAPTATTPAERAAAGREAIADCPEAFEDLQGDGDRELVEHAASKDENVLRALETIGDFSSDELPYLGKFLAGHSSRAPSRPKRRSSSEPTAPPAAPQSLTRTTASPTN
jgi:hypothetical protein